MEGLLKSPPPGVFCPTTGPPANSLVCILNRLICHFGAQNLAKVVLKNKPLETFSDPRTKGFKDGKFEAPTLEALLSLEDNLDYLMRHYNAEYMLKASTPLNKCYIIHTIILHVCVHSINTCTDNRNYVLINAIFYN